MFATFEVEFQSKKKNLKLQANKKPICLQSDTASNITLVYKNTYHKLGCSRIEATEHVPRNASGEVICELQVKGHKFDGVCYLTNRYDLDLSGSD